MLGDLWGGGRGGSSVTSQKSVSPTLWVTIGYILWNITVWFRSPSPHVTLTELKKLMLRHHFCKVELNHSWYPEREEQFVSYVSCYILFFFFLLRLSLCCVGWLRSGTNTEQTLLLSVATLASKRSKDNALQTGGGHAEAPPIWPSTSETNEAKMGAEKEKTKHGSTKIKQIQTSKEDKLLREGPKKEREKKRYLWGFLFFRGFFCTGV